MTQLPNAVRADRRGRVKPKVRRNGELWEACVTRGYEGNYETYARWFPTWREAFDWAHNAVKDWRR